MWQQASIQCLFYAQHCAKWIAYNPCSRQAKLFLTTKFHIPCRSRSSSKPFHIGVFCVNASAAESLISPKTTHSNIGNSNCWEVRSVRETPSVSGCFQKRLTPGTWKNQRRPCEVAETQAGGGAWSHLYWIQFCCPPRIHFYLEPQDVALVRKRRFADIIRIQ